MEREAATSWQVAELKRELESTHHESLDQATKVIEARAAELLVAEWATATEHKVEAVKVR